MADHEEEFIIEYMSDDPKAVEYIQERLLEMGLGTIQFDDLLMILSLHMEYMAMIGAAVLIEEPIGEGDEEMERQVNPEIENRYSSHALTEENAERVQAIREACKELAYHLTKLCPNSRELSTALTQLDGVMFHANAAIARNQK